MPGTPLTLGPLTEADVPVCAAIMRDSFPWTRYELSEDGIVQLWRGALSSGAAVTVARLDGQAAGFAWYIRHGGFGLSGYLKLLGVHSEARGRGVGGALLDHIERLTLADQQRDLLLLASDFNHSAHQFYQSRGYVQVGALPDYVQVGITELVFRKRLVPA